MPLEIISYPRRCCPETHHPTGKYERAALKRGHHSAKGIREKAVWGQSLTCQEDKQAQGHLLHVGALAWRGLGRGSSFSRATGMPLVPNPLLLCSPPRVAQLAPEKLKNWP